MDRALEYERSVRRERFGRGNRGKTADSLTGAANSTSGSRRNTNERLRLLSGVSDIACIARSEPDNEWRLPALDHAHAERSRPEGHDQYDAKTEEKR
jgi:hypothetical protein